MTLVVWKTDGDMNNYSLEETEENKEKYGTRWVGIKEELYQEFIAWLESKLEDSYDDDMKAWLEKVKTIPAEKALMFNQGDQFFAKHGVVEDVGTPIGEVKKPVAETLIEGMKKEES